MPKTALRSYISRDALFAAFASDDKTRNELDQVEDLKILKKTGLYQEDLAKFEDSKYRDKLSFEEVVKFCVRTNRLLGNIGDPDAEKNNTENRMVSWTEGKWSFTGKLFKRGIGKTHEKSGR